MRTVTPEDVLSFSSLEDVQVSPDGALIAFVRADLGKAYQGFSKSQIWVVPAENGEARAFTSANHGDWAPRWSPDGKTLAFLSNREGEHNQIFLLPRDGGEAQRLTDLKGDIQELEWSPDGKHVAFLMSDPEPEELVERRARGDDAIEFEKHHPWWRVWTVDVATGETRQVTTGDVQVWEFSWAPDGGFVLMTGAEPYEWSWFKPAIAHVGPEGGEPRTIYTAPEKCFTMPRLTPDGKHVAFLSGIWSDRGMNAGDLLLVSLEHANAVENLSKGYNGSIWWYQFSPDGAKIDFLAYEQGEAAIGQIDRESGRRSTRWCGEVAFSENHASRYMSNNGMLAFVRSDARTPQEVWVARPSEEGQARESLAWTQRTTIHARQAAELAVGETRTVRWKSVDGLEIQGILILPVGYTEGERVPLITWVHGGPAWLYTHAYQAGGRGLQMLAGAGYAVFLPNPRGSNGWGVPFLEQNIGDFGGKDYEDIISGIDALVGQGLVDPERLGIGGWSYGGFMTAWAISQTTRFKAAIVGAAITNWRSFHGAAHIGLWDRVSMRANPYELGGLYDQRSPISFVEHVTTPSLVLHGERDRIVPVDQGYEWFRALKDRGVPVEMVVYPREGHGISEHLHQLDRLRRWLAWLQKYV